MSYNVQTYENHGEVFITTCGAKTPQSMYAELTTWIDIFNQSDLQ